MTRILPARSPLAGSLAAGLPAGVAAAEQVDILAEGTGARVERIVSTGQATAPGEWYDQEADEWVLVVAGAARIRIEGEEEDRMLAEGDWILLPAHCRHRVTWTRDRPPTVWLAVHIRITRRS